LGDFRFEVEDIGNGDSPMENLTFIKAESFTFHFYILEMGKAKIRDGNTGFYPRRSQRIPFGMRKVAFWSAKGGLLVGKRIPPSGLKGNKTDRLGNRMSREKGSEKG
jgi:hypothetical protein